ncbi:hypothetical protein ABZ619_24790 [Streptomyces sp. NPDC007851]|uniref:hypothetical protein n=1 Tax=Streptomyces sp. NPDC007851 TaxID=3155008 RepID=UPI0033C0CAB7
MFSMPEQAAQNHRDVDALLVAVEHELSRIAKQRRVAKQERRRLRRGRRAEQARTLVRVGRPVLRAGLMFIASVAFVVGIVVLVLDIGDSRLFFELAAAACGIGAATPSGK